MLDSRARDMAPRHLELTYTLIHPCPVCYCEDIGQDPVLEGHPKQEDHAALT